MNNNKMVKYFLALFLTLTCLALTNTSTQPQKNDMPEKEVIEGMIYRWNYEGAIPAAEALLSKAKDNVSRATAHLLIARALAIKGIEYRDAIACETGKKHILEAFALAPSLKNEPDVANLRAQLMVFQMPKTPCELALAEAHREAEKEPHLAQTHFYLGLISFKLSFNDAFAPTRDEKAKLSDLAISEMKKAVQLDPKRYEFRAYYITALLNADKKEEARRKAEDMMKSADLSPDKISPSCSIPDEVYAATLEEKAGTAHIRQQAAKYPENAALQLAAATSYIQSEPVRARTMLQSLVDNIASGKISVPLLRSRVEVSALYKLGHLYSVAGEKKKALETYDKIVQLSPHYAEVHYNRGVVYYSMAQEAKAKEERTALLKKAKAEFETQTGLHFHDNKKTADLCRSWSEKIEKELKD
jgi:tetratricopeptide (TPR) repeat protein